MPFLWPSYMGPSNHIRWSQDPTTERALFGGCSALWKALGICCSICCKWDRSVVNNSMQRQEWIIQSLIMTWCAMRLFVKILWPLLKLFVLCCGLHSLMVAETVAVLTLSWAVWWEGHVSSNYFSLAIPRGDHFQYLAQYAVTSETKSCCATACGVSTLCKELLYSWRFGIVVAHWFRSTRLTYAEPS